LFHLRVFTINLVEFADTSEALCRPEMSRQVARGLLARFGGSILGESSASSSGFSQHVARAFGTTSASHFSRESTYSGSKATSPFGVSSRQFGSMIPANASVSDDGKTAVESSTNLPLTYHAQLNPTPFIEYDVGEYLPSSIFFSFICLNFLLSRHDGNGAKSCITATGKVRNGGRSTSSLVRPSRSPCSHPHGLLVPGARLLMVLVGICDVSHSLNPRRPTTTTTTTTSLVQVPTKITSVCLLVGMFKLALSSTSS